MTQRTKIAAAVFALTAVAGGVAHAEIVKMDGSSTVYPISEAVAEEFQKSKKNAIKVTVGISGTGGGFKKFCRGETDISNASRPILTAEMETCRAAGIKYIEVPIAFDALTVVINPANTWAKTMTIADLRKIWEPAAQGRIKTWKQVRSQWPAEPIMLFGPGADSGTFDYFTEAINGKAKASRGDYTASEDDNTLVQGVINNKNALGYFGFAYYQANKDKMTAVGIDRGKGPVLPSLENVSNASYNPLSRPLFWYVRDTAMQRPEVKEFVEFYMKNGATLTKEVKYVPLPATAYTGNVEHMNKKKLGTIFGGHNEIGITIEDLMKREAKN